MSEWPCGTEGVYRFAPVLNTLDDAVAVLSRLDVPDHPLVAFATEEVIACGFGLSTMCRVRAAVECAFNSVTSGRRSDARRGTRPLDS